MSLNKSLLSQITEKMKKPSKPKIARNQWQHPGEITNIPSNNITMQGVGFPVLGVPNAGAPQMMMPGQDYNFPGADNVTEYPMMGKGGYVVTRSRERKGKTHKVTGPDGTVKYFGDSKMGQHPNDPERKKAFYARHKKNLERNPYFRAFARATWAEGGEFDQMQGGGLWDTNRTAWVDSVNAANMDKNFVQRMYDPKAPQMYLPGSKKPSTHFMESGDGRVYPTVVQRPGNKFLEWLNQSNPDAAAEYAHRTGQYIQFPNDEQAIWYGRNGYKTGTGVVTGKKAVGGQLDQYQYAGAVAEGDATRIAAPVVMLTKKQLEESRAKARQVTEITNKANAKKLAERKKAIAESSDASIVNPNGKRFAIGDKFRLFPNDVSGVGEVFDNFINPFVFTGNTASALGNAMIDRDAAELATQAGMALGAGALGFDPLGGAMKLPGKLDKAIFPTRTYRSVVPGGNKLSYESSELADKVFSKGDWTTRDLRDAAQYLSGNEMEGGRRGLLTGNDMLFTEYKVPFWKKSVAYDPDVIALKELQGDVPDPSEFIIPNNKFLYPRRTNLIKAVPENVKAATATNIYGEPFTLYQPGKGILSYHDTQYSSPAYKYIEDQLNAVTGQQMPYTFDFGDLRPGMFKPSKMYGWKQPQFAPNEGIGSFSPFENGGEASWLDKYQPGGESVYNDVDSTDKAFLASMDNYKAITPGDVNAVRNNMIKYIGSPLYAQRQANFPENYLGDKGAYQKKKFETTIAAQKAQQRISNIQKTPYHIARTNQVDGNQFNHRTNSVELNPSFSLQGIGHEYGHVANNSMMTNFNGIKNFSPESDYVNGRYWDSITDKTKRPAFSPGLNQQEVSQFVNLAKPLAPGATYGSGDPHEDKTSNPIMFADESYGDLMGLRQLLHQKGYTKSFGDNIDQQLLNKALQDKDISNDFIFKRMYNKYGSDNMIKLNNTIAYNNSRSTLPMAQKGKENKAPIRDANGYINIAKHFPEVGDNTIDEDWVEKAEMLNQMYPGSRFVCTAKGCADIATSFARAKGYDFGRNNAWQLGNQNPVIWTNPKYEGQIGNGILPNPANYGVPSYLTDLDEGYLLGLNRTNNSLDDDGRRATGKRAQAKTKKDANDSGDYGPRLYPDSRGYEHIGYVNAPGQLVHGTGAGKGHPSYLIFDDMKNGIKLNGIGQYDPVEVMEEPGFLQQGANFIKNMFQSGGSIYDFMTKRGMDASYGSRKKMFDRYFDGNYTGTAAQNQAMLAMLQGAQQSSAARRPAQQQRPLTPNERRAIRKSNMIDIEGEIDNRNWLQRTMGMDEDEVQKYKFQVPRDVAQFYSQYKDKNKGKKFGIVSKQNARGYFFDEYGNLVLQDEVGLGSDAGDDQPIFYKKRTTPSGAYTMRRAGKISGSTDLAKSYGSNNFFTIQHTDPNKRLLPDPADPNRVVSAAVHGVPVALEKDRLPAFGNNNLDDNRMSAGCINCRKQTLDNPYFTNIPQNMDMFLYVTPEKKNGGSTFSGNAWYKKGGQTRNEREMTEGIADILSQVQDPQNRAMIAQNMMADFQRDNVTYNPTVFMQQADLMEYGGMPCMECGGMMAEGGQHGGLDRWFAEKWVDVKTGKPCGRQEGENRKGYPACRPSRRINEDTPKTSSEMSSAEREKFKRSKTSSERINYQHRRAEYGMEMMGEGGTNNPGFEALPEYVQAKILSNMAYGGYMPEMGSGGNVPTNPALWSRAKAAAKAKYNVYPSAYANGWAAKWYKSKGGGWRKAEFGMEMMDDSGLDKFQMAGQTVAYPDNTRVGNVARYTRPGNYRGQMPDTLGENIFEIVDPSGISSWDDVYRSYNDTGMSGNTAFEIFGAIPMLGKAKQFGTAVDALSAGLALTKRQKRNAKVAAELLKATGKYGPGLGRASDAGQAYAQYAQGGAPNNPGFKALPEFVQDKIMDNMAYGGAAQQAAIAIAMKKAGKKPKGQMAMGGQPQVGDEMDVTPEQLEELRKQGYTFEVI